MTPRRLRLPAAVALAAALSAALAAPAAAMPDIQHWQTANGARVYFVPAAEIPIVDVRIVFDAGSARDNGKAGLAMLTNGLLREGAGGLDADTLAARLDNIGAQLAHGSLRDMAWLNLRALSEPETLREATELLAAIVTRPDFPAAALVRDVKNMLVALADDRQSPEAIAENAFMRALYGEHPYASPPKGSEASLQAMRRADVAAFYRRYYVANNAVLAIVGDLERDQAEALAETLLGGLEPGRPAAALPPVPANDQAAVVHVPYPSAQTHIWIGQPGMKRGDEDYLPLYVGNHAFGGSGLVSLLGDEVREKRGYAYSVYSYFLPMRAQGPFRMVAQTGTDTAADALRVMRDTLDGYLERGMSAEQLIASKQNITGGFALRIDSNRKIAEYLAVIGFYNLPLDYLHTFNARVEALTRRRINAALAERVRPRRMVTVIVGPDNIATE